MKVLQLIDSLEAGGAERISVNYANILSKHIDSYLCTTRSEGPLLKTINENVGYLFLNKKSKLDIKAIFLLNKFIKKNKITIVHAHSSSFFLAGIMKLINYNIKIVWHDHYGNSENLDNRPFLVLKFVSLLFNSIIVVNTKLKKWAVDKLNCNTVVYMSNFVSNNPDYKEETFLAGEDGKRIVCLANLRPQKDHLNLLKAFFKLNKKYPSWTLHLVGKNFNDGYSESIFNYISKNRLKDKIFVYGTCSDIEYILSQSTIGVLSSKSEGLPVSLLEYGYAKLPVVVTNVGECSVVINNEVNGILVMPEDDEVLFNGLIKLIENQDIRNRIANELKKEILKNYSANSIISKILSLYKL